MKIASRATPVGLAGHGFLSTTGLRYPRRPTFLLILSAMLQVEIG